jgi:hypothetical protein
MTTPSQYQRLNEAAELYSMHLELTRMLCATIKKLHGGLTWTGNVDTEEAQQWRDTALAITQAVESRFHDVLDPVVQRLEELDDAIKSKLPKPPGTIIMPGDNN